MNFKKIAALFCALILIVSFSGNSVEAVLASSAEDMSTEALFEEVKEYLVDNYKDYYELDNFKFQVSDEESGEDFTTYIATFDMTLVKNPSELPFVKGLKEANLKSHKDDMARNEYYDEIVANIREEAYMVADETTFVFTVEKNSGKTLKDVKVLNDEEILPLNSIEIDCNSLYLQGAEAAKNIYQDSIELDYIEQDPIEQDSSWRYNRLAARRYAFDNAFAKPDYPNGDCANFVSKCLNNGGIPRTRTWTLRQPNWIRTGYHNNGGIVPYMTGRGYFYRQRDRSRVFTGSIVYWNTFSHVGLITFSDTVTLKYTAHTRARRNAVLPSSSNVSLYMYSGSIL